MNRTDGLTLIELIVAITVAGILITVGVPSFNSMYEASRSDSSIRTIQSSLTLARSQAVSYGARVTLCPLTGSTCTNKWKDGFTIFVNKKPLESYGAEDLIIKVIGSFNSRDFVTHSSNSISFTADGLAISGAGKFNYCPTSKNNENSKGIEYSASGKIKFVKGSTITCT